MGKLVSVELKNRIGTYGIYDAEDNLIYVGMGKNVQKRHSCHSSCLSSKKHGNKHLQAIYDESDVLYMKIIEYFDTKEEAIELEHELINSLPNLCNIRTKKANDISFSPASKMKMSRSQSGVKNGNSRLTYTQVGEILRQAEAGATQASLAKLYNISETCVHKIITGKTWKTVIYRFKGDGTQPPKEEKFLHFKLDKETSDGLRKLIKIMGVDEFCKIASRM